MQKKITRRGSDPVGSPTHGSATYVIEKLRAGEWREMPMSHRSRRAAESRLERLRRRFPQNTWRIGERPDAEPTKRSA